MISSHFLSVVAVLYDDGYDEDDGDDDDVADYGQNPHRTLSIINGRRDMWYLDTVYYYYYYT